MTDEQELIKLGLKTGAANASERTASNNTNVNVEPELRNHQFSQDPCQLLILRLNDKNINLI